MFSFDGFGRNLAEGGNVVVIHDVKDRVIPWNLGEQVNKRNAHSHFLKLIV